MKQLLLYMPDWRVWVLALCLAALLFAYIYYSDKKK